MRKDIAGYEGFYQIDELGNVYRLKGKGASRERAISHKKTKSGYFVVSLCKNGQKKFYSIHRLIAHAYIPNPLQKPEINHINGDKGDFSITNLEWCTKKENIRHAVETGLKNPSGACLIKGSSHHKSKLTPMSVKIIREASLGGHSNRNIGNYFKVSGNQISKIIRGINWKQI